MFSTQIAASCVAALTGCHRASGIRSPAYLIQNRERVVSKDDLIATIWKGRVISESALSTRINAVRYAVDDTVSGNASSVPFPQGPSLHRRGARRAEPREAGPG